MENVNFGPEEFKLLETEFPHAFWKMVANFLIRENKQLREKAKPDEQ